MARVLVGDDHAVVRRGLKDILSEAERPVTIDEAACGHDVLRKVQCQDYDVVFLDIALPDVNGLEVLSQLRALKPDLPVLIISIYPEEQYAIRALKSGAAGYVTKDSAPNELLEAFERVRRGRRYVSRDLADRLVGQFVLDGEAPRHEALSNREFQVMCLLAAGKTVSDIADELSLNVRTISTYRSRMLKKMDMSNNAEVVKYAMRRGLVE